MLQTCSRHAYPGSLSGRLFQMLASDGVYGDDHREMVATYGSNHLTRSSPVNTTRMQHPGTAARQDPVLAWSGAGLAGLARPAPD